MTLALISAAIFVMILYAAANEYRRRKQIQKKIELEYGHKVSDVPEMLYVKSFWNEYSHNILQKNFVDEITWNDLDMDSVYVNINCCQSGVGDLWLYTKLHINQQDQAFSSEVDLKLLFEKDPELRKRVQYKLAMLGHKGGLGIEMLLFYMESLQVLRPEALLLLFGLPFLSVSIWPLLGVQIGAAITGLTFCLNFLTTFYLRNKPGSGFPSVCAFASLLACAKGISSELKRADKDIYCEFSQSAGVFKNIHFPISIINFSDAMFHIGVIDFSSFFLFPILSYTYIVYQLKKHPEDILRLVKMLGEIDVAIGVGSLREMLPFFCRPAYIENKSISFQNAYHPLLENPVSNSAIFDNNVLFTGSNASGKSTFIKMIAVNCIVGNALDTCFAEQFCMRRAMLLSSMAIQDNILEGTSYFVAELQSIKRIIDRVDAGAFCYIFIDEILRGTNTLERISASAAILNYMASCNCLIIASTHDLELTGMLDGLYDNYHFKEEIANHEIHFNYELQKGPSSTRNALRLMEAMQYPDSVLSFSSDLVRMREMTGIWNLCDPQKK